jgi:hypothetical protein
VISKIRHVAQGLVEDLIWKQETGKVVSLEFVSKVSYRYKKNHMCHSYGQIVIKQVVKRLIVVIILKNFYGRKLSSLINKKSKVHIAETPSYNHFCIGKAISITYSVSRDSSVGIATDYGLDGQGIESRWGRDLSQTSLPALRPTQPPVQWVPGLSRG